MCSSDLVTALRLDQELEARRWTRDALQGSLPQDEAMPEAMTRLGDAWLAKGDLAAEESALAAALTILTQVVGDHDEQSLALLQRVGRLRLESGRSGAAALFARALAGREALDGREAPGVSELLGWLALAQLQESHADEARANAEERLTRLESAGNADPALLAEARALRAWATFCATGESAALAQVREFAQQRWALVALLRGVVGW